MESVHSPRVIRSSAIRLSFDRDEKQYRVRISTPLDERIFGPYPTIDGAVIAAALYLKQDMLASEDVFYESRYGDTTEWANREGASNG